MAYIDTSKVSIPKGFFEDLNVPKLLDWLNSQPTADVVEVKRGYWKREDNKVCYWYVCSECRDEIPRNKYGGWSFPNYCPNCGARMDGDVNDL